MNPEVFGHTLELSIVIPAYNASKYIIRTLTSLENQTVGPEMYRIIVVDDGSADDTWHLCTQFAQNHSNIRVIHQENGGVSAARNTGIAAATGKWISFVDSDDYVDRSYVETLITTCPEEDYLIFNHFAEYQGILSPDKEWLQPLCDCRHDISQVLLWLCDNRLNSPWDKRYSLDIIRSHSIQFRNGISMGEDLLFNFEYAQHIPSAYVSSRAIYVYTDNAEGLCRKQVSETRLFEFEAIYQAMHAACIANGMDRKYCRVINLSFLRGVARCAGQLYASGVSVKRITELFDGSNMVQKILSEPAASYKDCVRKLLLKARLYGVCAVLFQPK